NVRGDKKGGRVNKGSNRSPKVDRQDTTGYKKHPHGNNSHKNYTHKYIRKSQQGDEQLLNDDQKPRNNNRQYQNIYERVSIYNWDRNQITLETPIPERPKEKEILKEPRREDLNKLIDDIENQIDNAINKKNKKLKKFQAQIRTKNKNQMTNKPLYNNFQKNNLIFSNLKRKNSRNTKKTLRHC
ncbi:hypothetical protein IMG5_013670, partial [Ichthyophthirius multifiliis]